MKTEADYSSEPVIPICYTVSPGHTCAVSIERFEGDGTKTLRNIIIYDKDNVLCYMLVYYMCVNTVDILHVSFCVLCTDTQYVKAGVLCILMRFRLYLTWQTLICIYVLYLYLFI